MCLVYLAPNKGDLLAVSFRPVEEFNPITWSGAVKLPEKPDPKKSDKKKKQQEKKRREAGLNGIFRITHPAPTMEPCLPCPPR